MVTGWRRAFCTSISKDREPKVLTEKQQQHCDDGSTTTHRSPKISSKFGFFSNPSTPRLQSQPVSSPSLRCRTTVTAATTPNSSVPNSPKLHCNVSSTPKKNNNSPRLFTLSNPSSPKSPSSFSLLKSTLRLSKTRCGICLQSVKAGQGTAIFTAECSHSFHFPCIASHVKKNQILVCPVCSTSWKELPLLSIHHTQNYLHGATTKTTGADYPSKLKDVKTKSLRVYDDDEPLMSPTSGTRFNPIPETDEDERDENAVTEFQGFFVNNPSRTCANTSPRLVDDGDRITGNVEVRLLPEAAIVAAGRSYESYVVVLRVKAPPLIRKTTSSILNPARRAPIDLVTVVDVSSSMSGAKIQMLKRAMRLVISSLGSADRLSVVAFSGTSKRLLHLKRMTTAGRRSARRIVDALGTVGQGMSVSDALKKAAKVLEDRREKNPAAAIMLLSDSDHHHSPSAVAVSSTRFSSGLEVPVHAVGFGDPYSEDAFARCVGGLLSVVVSDLRLQLDFLSGSAPAEITAVYSLTSRPAALGYGSVRLGDLYAEEERELLVELKAPSSSSGSHRRHQHVLSVRSSYREPSSMELVYSREQALPLPRPQAARSSSPGIKRLRNLHVATRAVAESRRLAERNDLSGAHHLLSSARALLIQSSSALAEEYLRGLEAELSELSRLRLHQHQHQQRSSNRRDVNNRMEDKPEPLTPTSAWRAAERLAKVAIMRKSMNRVSDLHGFENA
ncbi:Cdk-activating kinase assembly factor, partial [Parasponia andersonii]